jgi:hypothetical protein
VVTVTEWLPLGALLATAKLAWTCVSVKEPLVTVTPLPAFTVGLVPNPLPFIVTLVVTPISPRVGDMLVTLGFTLAVSLPRSITCQELQGHPYEGE